MYGIPNRDCGNHSAGGLPAGQYRSWVAEIAANVKKRKTNIIFEPDALALLSQCGSVDGRTSEVRNGVLVHPAYVCIDASHSNWVAPAAMGDLLNRAGIASARGFATNDSNFNDSALE